ncbi:hypothetical protein AALO_G00275840 [Alosa alosa]|uniref:Uncharacterized protein n=1 Tax=Alosa alosa TaxID=278164 RepID=A0AAV6FI71_9TELE|nr:hypothetical protein AALO_G00275840 [Alosa alosa]
MEKNYEGNIEVPPEELEDDVFLYKKGKGISGAVRKVSSRLTNSIRNSFRRTGRGSPRPENLCRYNSKRTDEQ